VEAAYQTLGVSTLRMFLVTLLCITQISDGEAQIHGGQSQITGTWRGNSECVQRNGPCHDETNVYRFSEIGARPGWYSGVGSKVVNGTEVSMGTLDWKYDADKHILESETPNGTFRLVVDGDKIEGNLLRPDTTVYRRIHLEKQK
jgi:hypothetical protein